MDIDNPPPQDLDSVDPAQSLRAAALLSRKRRKVAVEQPPVLPQRPLVEQTLHLDYGQEDTATPSASSAKFPATDANVPSTSEEVPNPILDIEDGQIREEGEISDTEEAAAPPRPTSPPPKFRRLETSSKDAVVSKLVPTSPVESNSRHRPSPRLESPFASKPPFGSEIYEPPPPTFLQPFVLETSTYRLDPDHVRPGLAMTEDQYNTAKDIVLDLLGWGVPPEYLIDCGLSRHVVFYVFTELNLRMPTNLDTNGLVPYPTPEMLSSIPASPSQSIRSSSSAMPPPPTIPSHKELASPVATASDRPHSRLSARLGLRIPPGGEPTDVKVEPTSPSTADSSSHSLHMIEQQRRQELLARKAVFASRKAKQSDSPGGSSSRDRDVEMSYVAPTEIVEDFLKSIPAVDNEIADNGSNSTSLRPARYSSPENMEVDQAFAGLITPQSASSTGPSAFHSAASEASVVDDTISPVTDAPPWSGNSTAPSSDTYSGASSSTAPADYSNSTTPIFASSTPGFDSNGLQRRGTKRPVAADFVDFDHGPGPSKASSGNGYSSNGYTHPNLLRRTTGSFAGVSGMRRCVIELSDSEDDGDGEGTGGDTGPYDGPPSYSPMVFGRLPRFGGNGTPISSNNFANGEGRSTPPNLHLANASASLGMSPAALVEKEEEIKRMRQMIAQREELRQKKLAAMSGKATPAIQPAAAGPLTADPPVSSSSIVMVRSEGDSGASIKQEDTATLYNGHVGIAQSSEDAVMADTQDHTEGTAVQESADICVVISAEEDAPGDTSSEITSAKHTMGGAGFEPITNDGTVDEDQALAEEARSEKWESSSATFHQTAGVFDGPSSSEVPKKESEDSQTSFPCYDSPFSTYPLLLSQLRAAPLDADSCQDPRRTASHSSRSSSRASASYALNLSSPSSRASLIYCAPSLSHSCSTVFVPDLKPLKLASLQRALGQLNASDPGLRVCQYEVPGGGVCRDKGCNDLHLSRLVSEPSGTYSLCLVF
ncbi:hypothetical protein DEU56DRAFT_818040 [Suillus clintonianus]|uniref:uncharacterized protein n=1 Tax=Suillus clintonianus TaxID=1904413 RepID=UPI001B873C9A|nr:uncharacterized protein DEU56DRAFT_818040 [Suillus clintonianus]KAG2129148.1 hypothetical protein DEU56DRAFT_818040 [Suillus clintonianus]